MAAATLSAPGHRGGRVAEPYGDRALRQPMTLEEHPEPFAAPRGIALAVAMGALAWVFVIAAFFTL